jgi:hypothetical protein
MTNKRLADSVESLETGASCESLASLALRDTTITMEQFRLPLSVAAPVRSLWRP